MRKLLIFLTAIFFIAALRPAYSMPEDKNFNFSISSYFRQDLVNFENVVDLDNKNSDDSTLYLGVDYNIGFNLEFKNNGPRFYLKLERNGPFDYSSPLFVHNTLMNTGGVIEKYRNDELLPQAEEFWLDTPLFGPSRFKIGLYTYEVGNGFSLNGSYENYGFTFYRESEDLSWRFYYCRPDVVYKNHLGPRIRQEEEQGIIYNHGAANFFATDIKFKKGKSFLQPYIGVLTDYTAAGKRDNYFTAPIKRDILGTAGLTWHRKHNRLSYDMEVAHNFGKGQSSDAEYKNIYHTGYLAYGGLDYTGEKIQPSFKFLLASGNKVTPEMAQDETISSSKNRAFSYYSPLNNNLGDAIGSSNVDILPIVAMAGGYGLHYGIPRPGAFGATDFDNLILACLGSDFTPNDKLTIGLYGYSLRSFEKGVGTFDAEAKYLSCDLGREIDLFIDYQLNQNILVSIMGGYFFPGKYYKERRDDADASLFSPYIRGDGNVDAAYQIELALEFQY